MAHAPSRSMHQLVSYRDMTNAASSGSTSKTRPTGTISIGIFQDYGLAHSHIGANKKKYERFPLRGLSFSGRGRSVPSPAAALAAFHNMGRKACDR